MSHYNLRWLMCNKTKPDQTKSNPKCPAYDTKLQEVVKLWLSSSWEYGITLSFPFLRGYLRPKVIAPVRYNRLNRCLKYLILKVYFQFYVFMLQFIFHKKYLFRCLIAYCRLFTAKAILVEDQQWYYSTHSREG